MAIFSSSVNGENGNSNILKQLGLHKKEIIMFSESIKEFITENVKGCFKLDISNAIDIFDKALSLDSPSEEVGNISDLVDLLESLSIVANWKEKKVKTGYLLLKLESYLKFLLGNIDINRYNDGPSNRKDRKWMLESLLKEGLNLVPATVNLASGRPVNESFPYQEQYISVYQHRNIEAHCYVEYSHEEIFTLTRNVLIVYLDASYKFSKKIKNLYEKMIFSKSFHVKEYCKNIKDQYEKMVKLGFEYVDIKWKRENEEVQISSITKLKEDSKSGLIKLLGEAGSGKTTALKRLEYLEAKKCVKTGAGVVPVYIPLSILESDSSISPKIIPMIATTLNISEDNAERMVEGGECVLLLDGYNEILNGRAKRQFANSIDCLVRKHQKLTIFLTDRAIVKNRSEILVDAERYRFYPLDNSMKKTFIENICTDENAKKIILDHMKTNPEYFNHFITPSATSTLYIPCL